MEQQQYPGAAERPTSLYPIQPEIPPHDSLMDDLYRVGPDKPIGYLPVRSIYDRGEHPDTVATLSQERGLSIFWREPRDDDFGRSVGDTGDLYVFDTLALTELLQRHASILQKHQWPITPADFVARVAVVNVDSKRQADLYRLIAHAFSDPEYAQSELGGSTKTHTTGLLARLASAVLKR